jgi:antitoxin component YwqK of YwqJK toxin-antitoxin module
MRLFEVEDHFASDLETVMRNLLTKKATVILTYDEMSNILKNMGYGPIDYDGFAKLYDANPSFEAIVQNFNESGIVLSKEKEIETDDQESEAPTVDQMASNGAKASLENPLA